MSYFNIYFRTIIALSAFLLFSTVAISMDIDDKGKEEKQQIESKEDNGSSHLQILIHDDKQSILNSVLPSKISLKAGEQKGDKAINIQTLCNNVSEIRPLAWFGFDFWMKQLKDVDLIDAMKNRDSIISNCLLDRDNEKIIFKFVDLLWDANRCFERLTAAKTPYDERISYLVRLARIEYQLHYKSHDHGPLYVRVEEKNEKNESVLKAVKEYIDLHIKIYKIFGKYTGFHGRPVLVSDAQNLDIKLFDYAPYFFHKKVSKGLLESRKSVTSSIKSIARYLYKNLNFLDKDDSIFKELQQIGRSKEEIIFFKDLPQWFGIMITQSVGEPFFSDKKDRYYLTIEEWLEEDKMIEESVVTKEEYSTSEDL